MVHWFFRGHCELLILSLMFAAGLMVLSQIHCHNNPTDCRGGGYFPDSNTQHTETRRRCRLSVFVWTAAETEVQTPVRCSMFRAAAVLGNHSWLCPKKIEIIEQRRWKRQKQVSTVLSSDKSTAQCSELSCQQLIKHILLENNTETERAFSHPR